MKKLLIKIFLMMLLSMGLVFAISRIALFVMQLDGSIDTKIMYYISLISGVCGLILFAVLLNFLVIRRLKKLAVGVGEIAKGNYEVTVSDKGLDELQKLIESFNSMASELKSNEYLNLEYIKNVSHELKTPLSSIMGYAELLMNDKISGAEKKEYVDIILSEAHRLLYLDSQMLEICRVDSHTIIAKSDIFDVDEQIRECILLQQNEWQNKSIELFIEMNNIKIKSNAELTRHIWQNLISNAIKYCNSNGKISIKLYQDNVLHFEISNTGEGISEEERPHIFRQFYTADRSKNKQGNGLGLALVKKIVDKLDGSISFESNKDQTLFSVDLK